MIPSSSSRIAIFALLSAQLIGWGIMDSPFAAAITQDFLAFTFHLHDNLEQPANNSAYFIVQPLEARTLLQSDTLFGGVVVWDDSATVDPDPSSLEIGRSRGTYIYVGNSTRSSGLGPGVEFLFSVEFNEASGYGEGSTLTFKGYNRFFQPVREIPIVGGTGKFRLARGWALISTYSATGTAYGSVILNVTANVFYGFG